MDDNKLEGIFGFFFCTIHATEVSKSYVGLLPTRTANTQRVGGLIVPTGKWSGWYFSEELKFADKYGYKISVIKGYDFSRESNVFNSYVSSIYNEKTNAVNYTNITIAIYWGDLV